MDGRCMNGCNDIYSSYAHGTKGMAIVSKYSDCGMPSSTHRGLSPQRDNVIWTSKVEEDEKDPYLNEWNDLLAAIRADKPTTKSNAASKPASPPQWPSGCSHRPGNYVRRNAQQ